MASPNTLKRNEQFASLNPHPILAISKRDRLPCGFRNGLPNEKKQAERQLKGLNRGNGWGKPWGVEAQMKKDRDDRGRYVSRKLSLIRKALRQAAVRDLIRVRKETQAA